MSYLLFPTIIRSTIKAVLTAIESTEAAERGQWSSPNGRSPPGPQACKRHVVKPRTPQSDVGQPTVLVYSCINIK